jgi:AcrR family transcriptional regulator
MILRSHMKVQKKPNSRSKSLRKAPEQERSKALVEALLRTTARILLRDGWHGLSTNRVAREAGVSVGSLYQYFPNKDALVHALVVDLAEQMGDELVALGKSLLGAPLDKGVDAIVRAALDTARKEGPLFRAVLVELPRIGALEAFDRLNRRTADALAEWIASRRHELDIADPSLTAHVLVTALDALTDQALVFRPELLQSVRFEEELRKLVAGYLGVPRTPAPSRHRAPRKAP